MATRFGGVAGARPLDLSGPFEAAVVGVARARVVLALAILTAGCNSYSDARFFRVLNDGTFEYVAFADWSNPPGNEWAEQERLTSLMRHLQEKGMCPKGYEVLSRAQVDNVGHLGTGLHAIVYNARCLPEEKVTKE